MAITFVGSAQVQGTSTTRTLNCAAGGDWTATPQVGDLMVVNGFEGDNSGIPTLTPPAGWTLIRAQGPASDLTMRTSYRFATSPESTYTWTAVNNGQTGQYIELQGVCLRGTFVGTLNPTGFDPSPFGNVSQTFSTSQNAPAIVEALAGSAVFAVWAYDVSDAHYTALNTLNGVAASATLLDTASAPTIASGAFATGCWIGPGVGTWTATATMTAGGIGVWGSVKFGVKAAVGNPQRTLVGVGT